MNDWLFRGLLLVVPVAIGVSLLGVPPVAVFLLSALGIIPLAKYLGEATEDLATRVGPAAGGLLNATFGNATELIIGIFAIQAGLLEVVKASITGSIIGNLLFVLGTSVFLGGMRHRRQTFNRTAILASGSTLFLAVIALVVPAIFASTSPGVATVTREHLSLMVAALMLLVYAGHLVFTFYTHTHLYTEEVGEVEGRWSVSGAVTVLVVSTLGVAWLSEILVSSIKPAIAHLGWTQLFIGAVVIAIIGNAAEHYSAVTMAMKNRMDLSLQISIGSATQIALLVAPLFVIIGQLMGQPMDLIFNTFELVGIVVSVIIVNLIVEDGESNWFEGLQLLSAYLIIALAFYFHP